MKPLYRDLARFALVGTTVGFAAASYAREGMSPLDVLPTLLSPTPWLDVAVPLGIVTAVCTLIAMIVCRHNRIVAAEGQLIVQAAATMAAITTYAYDLCQNVGLKWLPTFGGCHCWLTGAAALCTALLSTVVLFLVGVVSVEFIRTLYTIVSQYLRRRVYRPFLGRMRHRPNQHQRVVRVRLLAFRGPPIA